MSHYDHHGPDDLFDWPDAVERLRMAGRGRSGGRGGGGGPEFFRGFGGGFPPGPPPPGGGGPPMSGLPWAFWSLFRRGARARRGDVRAAILSLLSEQPRNGYQMMRELAERSQGAWRPSPGSVYPQLQQLEDEGLVRQEASGVAPGGRVFALTDAGRTYVEKHRDELAAAWENTASSDGDGTIFAVMTQLRHIAGAAMQLVQSGNAAQIGEAQKILARARRALYNLLADDSAPFGDEDDGGDE
jgi:DNA-binding PadR family transcriptional regulator